MVFLPFFQVLFKIITFHYNFNQIFLKCRMCNRNVGKSEEAEKSLKNRIKIVGERNIAQ